jgi:hypothetical protein
MQQIEEILIFTDQDKAVFDSKGPDLCTRALGQPDI